MAQADFDPASVAGRSVVDLIDHWAAQRADDAFIIDPASGETLTFAALQKACRRFSLKLDELDIASDASVAYALDNGFNAVRTILGTLYSGRLAVAVNLVSGQNTIAYVLQHSDAALVFADERSQSLIESALGSMAEADRPVIELVDESCFAANGSTVHQREVDQQTAGLLMYTSGTTGVPKGVVHTHGSLIAGGCNTALAHELSLSDRGLCVLPLYHINAFCVSLMGALVSGSSLVMPDRFSVSRFWGQVRNQACTWFSVVPTHISYLVHEAEQNGHRNEGLEQLRFGRSASAPLAPEVQQAFEDRFGIPIIETMGLTETAAQILSNPMHGVRKIGSPGIPYGNEVIIADDQQRECARETEGEVLVRGPNVMREYRKNPDVTAETITADGWLRTGDLGRMDADGYVFITGRLKELIIKGGENIAPREIDEALYAHSDVVEAAAFARDCTRYGQTVEAAVKLSDGSAVTTEALRELCRDRIGAFKTPDRIHVLPELPKGPSGKIQRVKLVELTQK